MSFLISLILQILGISIIVSLLAVLMERVLIVNGFTRGNTIGLVIALLFMVTLTQLAYPRPSKYLLWFVLAFIGVMSGNRYDLTMTMEHGRWWWKKEDILSDQNKDTLQGGTL